MADVMTERSYFDWNATAPLRPQAAAALQGALALPGNPSSVHGEGRAARRLVERAREEVAALVGARAGDVFSTSSGTEANMLALTPALETVGEKRPRDRLLLSAIEHSSVRTGGRFPRDAVADIAVDADGRVDLAALTVGLSGTTRPLVSIMLANNETGALQPVAEAAAIAHAAGGLFHVDAVQAVGRDVLETARASADRSTCPSALTPMSSTPLRGNRPPARTEECSIADLKSRSRGRFSSAVSMAGVSASILASVPLEVKNTSAGRAATSAATCSRACSIRRRAARPSAWTEEGLPRTADASCNAWCACGRSGVVAFQSK